jgi:hypothetical protein
LPDDAPQIPGYKLIHVLGDGGFSTVYLASHFDTGELRAVKVGPLDDLKRFNREVDMLANLESPYVVGYYEHGALADRFWIAMEYLGDFTLTDLIRTSPSAEHSLLLAAQVLRGLESLHESSVIHRDLKPDNVMVDPEFHLKLIDFGLAKPLPGAHASQANTLTVGLIGTPRYMSPEQISPEQILAKGDPTFASDLWAFGCILFELLTGQPPFVSTNILALGHEIMTKQVLIDQPKIPEEVRPFLKRCLEREPTERWANATQALPHFKRDADDARRRLRHERFQESWGRIVEKGLLERFAASHKGRLPDDGAAPLFGEFARQEGIVEGNEERLGLILGPIFSSQERVEAADREVVAAKEQLGLELGTLGADQIKDRAARISDLERSKKAREADRTAHIRKLLEPELRSWAKTRQLASEAEQKREAERLRLQKEAEQRRQERKRRIAQVARLVIPPTALGALLFGTLGWLVGFAGEGICSLSACGH